MALLLKSLINGYARWVHHEGDERTKHLYLVRSPIPLLFIMVTYLVLVKAVLPNYMKNKKPFNLDNLMIGYNLLQILLNSYVVVRGFPYIITLNMICADIDYSSNPDTDLIIHLIYLYFIIKFIDMADTFFFILRKKEKQVTFLHVYHHMNVPVVGWVGSKYLTGGHSVYLGYINSFVHAVMYSYYLFAICNRQYNSVWFKKYLTQLQLLQFVSLSILYMGPLVAADCTFPKTVTIAFQIQNLLMIFLFADFYYKAYIRKNKREEAANKIE